MGGRGGDGGGVAHDDDPSRLVYDVACVALLRKHYLPSRGSVDTKGL